MVRRICVFAGSSPGIRPAYAEAAQRLGEMLAARGLGLVYGGGSVGIMGAVADATLAGGGEVIGIIPRALAIRDVAHAGLTELRVVDSMHERKAQMAELSDAFIALPGGLGTFEELFEMLTWAQLGFHPKPVGLLNVAQYYAPLLTLVEHAASEGFIPPWDRDLLLVGDDPTALIDRALAYQPVARPDKISWITREET